MNDKTNRPDTAKLLFIGAHPDDPDISCGGTAIRLLQENHSVMFLSMTNGNAGHAVQGGSELSSRRYGEAQKVADFLGLKYVFLDNNDGELQPTIENRNKIIRIIREYQPTIIITHRPNDYHTDHRNTSILVQDSAYLVAVPNICPLTPRLEYNPVILYSEDKFTKPALFSPDIIVDITKVFDKKMKVLSFHESQYFEWLPFINGFVDEVPSSEPEKLEWLKKRWGVRSQAERYRELLGSTYSKEEAWEVEQCEAFEICEYGGKIDITNQGDLFPVGVISKR